MKKSILIIVAIVLILAIGFFAVKGLSKNKKENSELNAESYKSMSAEDLLSHIANKESVTPEEYIWLVSTYQFVEIKDDLTLDKNITDEAIKSLDSKAKPSLDTYIGELLESESAQVRGYGISLITSLTGVSSKNLELAKNLIKNEKSPYVLCKATRALSNEAKSNKEIADFLLKMAENENANIRKEAAIALGNSWSKGVDGAVDTIIKLMDDKDQNVRKTACRYSGKLADEKVIEPLVKILNNAEDADIHGDCVEGLVTLWYDYPFFKNTSEKAYNATMDYFKKTPRTDKVPAWTAVGAFRTTSTQDSFKTWKENAKYFNTDELYNVMVDIIKDSNASYLARTSAIDEIKAHCSAEKFAELKSVIDSLTDTTANQVKSSYENKAK